MSTCGISMKRRAAAEINAFTVAQADKEWMHCFHLKERCEVHHGVRITDSAIVTAASLSERCIADRFLPDKTIDLIDEYRDQGIAT